MTAPSGPVVPLLDVSAGSSGLAFVAAASFGDREFLRGLYTTLGFAAYITSFISTDIGRGNAWSYTVAILTLIIAIFYMKLLYGRGDIRS